MPLQQARPARDQGTAASPWPGATLLPSRVIGDTGESELVAGLRARDELAFALLVKRHGGALLAAARRVLRNEEDARDAVQEAFLSALKAIERFQGGSSLSTWLHRIAINAALMQLRRRRSRPEAAIDELLPEFLEDGHHAQHPEPWEDSAEVLLARSEVRRHVRHCIERLPESYRTVLVLRDIEELDTEEAARLLGISANLVKVRLHRARQALRTLLAGVLERSTSGCPPPDRCLRE